MLAYQSGDIKAFECLYKKHKGPLYRYFIRQLKDEALAQDLYQDVWSRVIKAAANYQVNAKFTTWLYKIAHNLIIDHVRAVKPLDDTQALGEDQTMDDFMATEATEPEVQFQQSQQAKTLQHCIDSLPSVQKEAFLLNVELGLTASVISEIAQATLEATKSRIRYAYQNIKTCVSQQYREA
ncbi:sigma-70 family RNA polymerase sigma factor [Shewanella gaetbuli]|uniref:Sigma-70 family RNA polymerase sigma factor n=1 Tax=Shewanella gaetbuli TaxID=220752 RepID=A0A9X2CKN0_9GAMM|nr:sigma-70 family RNA polymerase sigma factor [Shewanella gaetbuli]MCL1141799.1 sigma-70 family RNA polymerase sigma factor [Shewanella gaetbuli]